jgi:hypothetical protein
MVEQYTARQLMLEKDRPVTISGLSSAFEKQLGHKVLAGISEIYAIEHLTWRIPFRDQRSSSVYLLSCSYMVMAVSGDAYYLRDPGLPRLAFSCLPSTARPVEQL